MQQIFQRIAWLPFVAAAAILFYAARDLPTIADPNAPASTHVSPRYIESAVAETGAANMVTAVLADYRAYDTLGETVVILTAGLACLLVLGAFTPARSGPTEKKATPYEFGSDIVDATSRLLIPFISLFAFYVVVHGHTSPGGGFQGGAICAAAIILVRLVRGRAPAFRLLPTYTVAIGSIGVLVYTGTGLVSLFFEKNFLDYSGLPLPFHGGHLREMGSLSVETGVFITVTAVMVLIFDVLTMGSEE